MYHFYTNGLAIYSEIFFPELTPYQAQGQSDITICYGKAPDLLSEVKYKSLIWQSSGTEFLLKINGICKYYVKNGTLTVEPVDGADEGAIRLYILSSIFPLFLYSKNFISLHGSCVAKDNNAILFCGYSGAGKSTTALGFNKRGYEILNDDVSSIFLDNNALPHVSKGYLQLKLLPNSLQKYGYRIEEFSRLTKNWDKFSYPVKRSSEVINSVPITNVFFIEVEDRVDIVAEPVEGLTAFGMLRRHTFRYWMAKELNKLGIHFNVCNNLIDNVNLILIRRPINVEPDRLVDFMQELIREKRVYDRL